MKVRLGVLLPALLLAGCSAFVERAASRFADDLETAIREYSDPGTVATALPAWLMLIEARIQSSPDNATLRRTAARLTSTHALLFAGDETSPPARRLTTRALEHARAGACLEDATLCRLDALAYEDFERRVDGLERHNLDAVYVLASVWVSWIAAHVDDFDALADLPRARALLEWAVEREPGHDDGAGWLYLAVLHSQRPPAAGGQPQRAREYFQRARQESQDRNLIINVMMAEHYARLLFDRELYVSLLEDVLESDVDDPDFRLVNQVARQRAVEMLDRTEAIFD